MSDAMKHYAKINAPGYFSNYDGECSLVKPRAASDALMDRVNSHQIAMAEAQWVTVTAEMIAAGRAAFGYSNPALDYPSIYRSMHALAPVELVSEGERQALRERDEARALASQLEQECCEHASYISSMVEKIDAKDTRIAELKYELASRPAAFVDPEPERLKHNPFREFIHDRRKMGPL